MFVQHLPLAVLLFKVICPPHHKGRINDAVRMDSVPSLHRAYKGRISVNARFHGEYLDITAFQIAKGGIKHLRCLVIADTGIRRSIEPDCFFRPVFGTLRTCEGCCNVANDLLNNLLVIHNSTSAFYKYFP